MKAVVAAFNQEKALVGAFSVITNLRMELFEALVYTQPLTTDTLNSTLNASKVFSKYYLPKLVLLIPLHCLCWSVDLREGSIRVTRDTWQHVPRGCVMRDVAARPDAVFSGLYFNSNTSSLHRTTAATAPPPDICSSMNRTKYFHLPWGVPSAVFSRCTKNLWIFEY